MPRLARNPVPPPGVDLVEIHGDPGDDPGDPLDFDVYPGRYENGIEWCQVKYLVPSENPQNDNQHLVPLECISGRRDLPPVFF